MPGIALWLLLGAVLAAAYLALGYRLGARAARAWWSGGLVLAAALYVGFAVARSAPALAVLFELGGVALYGALAWRGLRGDLRWTAAGWMLHVLWDVGLHGPGGVAFAPLWYVWACLSFDVVVGVVLGRRATRGNG